MHVTVSQMNRLVTDFETYLAVDRRRSPLTVLKYVDVLQDFVLFCEQTHGKDSFDLERMSKVDLTLFLRGVTLPGATSTWNARLAALRAFYEQLFKDERIGVNPAKRIDRQKVLAKEAKTISLDEFIDLVDAVEFEAEPFYRPRYVAILQVFFHCSLRVAEVVSLNVDQVDFDRCVLRDVRRKGGLVFSVAFNDVVAVALSRYLRDRAAMHVPESERALFVSDRKKRIAVRSVEEFVSRYGVLAGIKRRISPHTLRHASASVLADNGVPIRVVQDRLGHAEVTTTERYTHVRSQQQRVAATTIGSCYQARKSEMHAQVSTPMT